MAPPPAAALAVALALAALVASTVAQFNGSTVMLNGKSPQLDKVNGLTCSYKDAQGNMVQNKCNNVELKCPAGCRDKCDFSCQTCQFICPAPPPPPPPPGRNCRRPGNVCADPRFVGGDGNTFLFHGRRDADFCLVSDVNLHVNAHFIGKPRIGARRDFTWVQAIGVRFDDHRLYVGVKKTAEWDDDNDRLEIALDETPVVIDEAPNAAWPESLLRVPGLSIYRTWKKTNSVVIHLSGRVKIAVDALPVTPEDSRIHSYGLTAGDSLAHLDLAFKFYTLTDDVHGVLGQTYRPDYTNGKIDVGARIPVMGGAAGFETTGIFAADCAVSRFARTGKAGEALKLADPASARCGGAGADGEGLVCKK